MIDEDSDGENSGDENDGNSSKRRLYISSLKLARLPGGSAKMSGVADGRCVHDCGRSGCFPLCCLPCVRCRLHRTCLACSGKVSVASTKKSRVTQSVLDRLLPPCSYSRTELIRIRDVPLQQLGGREERELRRLFAKFHDRVWVPSPQEEAEAKAKAAADAAAKAAASAAQDDPAGAKALPASVPATPAKGTRKASVAASPAPAGGSAAKPGIRPSPTPATPSSGHALPPSPATAAGAAMVTPTATASPLSPQSRPVVGMRRESAIGKNTSLLMRMRQQSSVTNIKERLAVMARGGGGRVPGEGPPSGIDSSMAPRTSPERVGGFGASSSPVKAAVSPSGVTGAGTSIGAGTGASTGTGAGAGTRSSTGAGAGAGTGTGAGAGAGTGAAAASATGNTVSALSHARPLTGTIKSVSYENEADDVAPLAVTGPLTNVRCHAIVCVRACMW